MSRKAMNMRASTYEKGRRAVCRAGFARDRATERTPARRFFSVRFPTVTRNAQVVGGRFLVYDPVHLAADGSLKVLWDSQRWNIQFLFNKFTPPVVDGGQIYVPNYNGGVDLYRLTQ